MPRGKRGDLGWDWVGDSSWEDSQGQPWPVLPPQTSLRFPCICSFSVVPKFTIRAEPPEGHPNFLRAEIHLPQVVSSLWGRGHGPIPPNRGAGVMAGGVGFSQHGAGVLAGWVPCGAGTLKAWECLMCGGQGWDLKAGLTSLLPSPGLGTGAVPGAGGGPDRAGGWAGALPP